MHWCILRQGLTVVKIDCKSDHFHDSSPYKNWIQKVVLRQTLPACGKQGCDELIF